MAPNAKSTTRRTSSRGTSRPVPATNGKAREGRGTQGDRGRRGERGTPATVAMDERTDRAGFGVREEPLEESDRPSYSM